MKTNTIIGLLLVANGTLIVLPSVSLYRTNVVGLLIGGAIMLAGAYMVLREEF